MREPALIRWLADGPMDLILQADGVPDVVHRALEAAARRFVPILGELCAELPLLRSPAGKNSPRPQGTIAKQMFAAVESYGERCFVTPMAAVAGAVAEAVLAAMTREANLERAYVNNGGDIAIYLVPGRSYTIGMVERPENPSLFGSVEISAASPVRGVATSGWRGRSFSLGIADAVTVLASTASRADAAATIIANAVDLPGHPAISRIPAREIAPDSDLGNIRVTRGVAPLSAREIEAALDNGARVAEELRDRGLIHAAALCLERQVRIVGESFGNGFLQRCAPVAQTQSDVLSRSVSHA